MTNAAKRIEIDSDVRIAALAKHLECELDEIDSAYGETCFTAPGRSEYLVMTDSEADQAWEESLDSYIDD